MLTGTNKAWVGNSSNVPIELLSTLSNIPSSHEEYSMEIKQITYEREAGSYYNLSYEANFIILGYERTEYYNLTFIGKTFVFNINGVIDYPGHEITGIPTGHKTYIDNNGFFFPDDYYCTPDEPLNILIFKKEL